MLSSRYMVTNKNLPAILQKIVEGAAPEKFTVAHLKGLGFTSSNDQGVLPLLKDLKFLSADGTPTPRYHRYRDKSQSRRVLGEALREAYEDLFHINEHLSDADKQAVVGRFKSTHNVTDLVAERQAATFLSLLKLADLPKSGATREPDIAPPSPPTEPKVERPHQPVVASAFAGLRYNIEVHLPATKDIEVYNAIFKSLREHLLDD
ncbi:MAG TPA: DUF5343 domain-containing protein [Longimicrobium sp.]|nr:DUF5343 domain-containing protein [Longimicrobium sp.]